MSMHYFYIQKYLKKNVSALKDEISTIKRAHPEKLIPE
jgi:hypothetical protein